MNKWLKRGLLVFAFASVFATTYSVSSQAFAYSGTLYGRASWVGYFTGISDTSGTHVFPKVYQSGTEAFPNSINSADELYDFVVNYQYHGFGTAYGSGTTTQRQRGAAFIVNTMLGHGAPGHYWLTDEDKNNWYEMLLTAQSQGRINWRANFGFNINSYYQGTGGGSNPADDAFYGENGTAPSMLFYNGNGQLWYALKWECANPVSWNTLPGPTYSWEAQGTTSISDGVANAGDTATSISTRPGDVLRWSHYIQNYGPANSGHWWRVYGTQSSSPWTAQYFNNINVSGTPVVTQTENVDNLEFTNNYGSPHPSVVVDGFSARWTKTENLPAGNYEFMAYSDDGMRLYIDGVLRINDWNGHGVTLNSYTANLSAGNHTIVVEYQEQGGPGEFHFRYKYLTQDWIYFEPISPGQNRLMDNDETFTVPVTATPGTKYCRNIIWHWKTSWQAGDWFAPPTHLNSGYGQMACATVIANFNLVPTINIQTPDGDRVVQQGEQVTFRYLVDNTGATTSSSTTCTITGTQPSGTPAPPGTNCPRTFAAPGGAVEVTNSPEVITISTQPAGSQICRTLTVDPSSFGGGPATSGPQCVIVAKTPYVHFFGGDVWAGGGFAAADGTCATNTAAKITTVSNVSSNAGSMVEYGAFALNDITRFGSGSKALHSSADFSSLARRLTFSNNTAILGDFGAPQHCMNDYAAAFQSAPLLGAGVVNVGTQGSGQWRRTGNLTLSGNLPLGGRQVYVVSGDVTINSDLRYVGAAPVYNSPAQIPSLLVIASGNILVGPATQRLDGMFIARNTFYTCYPKPVPPSINTCNNLLTVNGAVIAGSLDLYRTRGADGATPASRQLPAEIFNLSPELFLNNVLNTTSSQSVTTSNSRELPPRF